MMLYVGNLDYEVTEAELRQAFAIHGEVVSARVIVDHESGRSRGFGFVEMATEADGAAALAATNGQSLLRRKLRVSPADRRR